MGKLRDTHFALRKKYKPTKQAFKYTGNLHGFVWNSGCSDHIVLPNILPKDVKADYFAKGTEKGQNLGNLMDKEV